MCRSCKVWESSKNNQYDLNQNYSPVSIYVYPITHCHAVWISVYLCLPNPSLPCCLDIGSMVVISLLISVHNSSWFVILRHIGGQGRSRVKVVLA